MHERELEEVMMRFAEGDIDVLVATTIIENGLDIPNANTIIINRADHFGLAQLYQLRGPRGPQRAARPLLPALRPAMPCSPMTPGGGSRPSWRAAKSWAPASASPCATWRFAAPGELLGARQHGHIDSVGFDLYTRLLAQAINEARRKKERFEKAIEGQVRSDQATTCVTRDEITRHESPVTAHGSRNTRHGLRVTHDPGRRGAGSL